MESVCHQGASTTRSVKTPLRSRIPVKTPIDRDICTSDFFAFDTVSHCGPSARGQFCKTLTGTDVFSEWLEERSLLNAANHWVFEVFSDIHRVLPFPLKGAHYDFDTAEECDAVAMRCPAEGYRRLCPLYNYRMPSFRLIAKEKQADGRCRKVYEKKPRTSYERLMEPPDVSEECKGELLRRRVGYNPVAMNRRLNEAVGRILKINREKSMVKKPSVRRMVGPRWSDFD